MQIIDLMDLITIKWIFHKIEICATKWSMIYALAIQLGSYLFWSVWVAAADYYFQGDSLGF